MSNPTSETLRWPPRPTLSRRFYKGSGLGNDYLVFEEGEDWVATEEAVVRVCDRHDGVGSDGIVALLNDRSDGVFLLRMFNPDGGEFERSGNGLRIFGSHLARSGEVGPFVISVGGEQVALTVHGSEEGVFDVSVDMGKARIGPESVALDPELLDSSGRMPGPDGEPLRVVCVSMGNPHLVVLVDDPTADSLARIGPFFVGHPGFTHGTNVQLACPAGERSARALIWERGVGPTTASGTSACAVGVAMVVTGALEPGQLAVEMLGGRLGVSVTKGLDVELRGPVAEVCDGVLAAGVLAAMGEGRS